MWTHKKAGQMVLPANAIQTGKYPAGNGNGNGAAGPTRMPSPQELAQDGMVYGETVVNSDRPMQMGGIAGVPGNIRYAQFLTIRLDNSAGIAITRYRFGSELATGMAGQGALPRATSGSAPVIPMYESLAVAPILVREIQMRTSSDPGQFDQFLQYFPGTDVDSSARGNGPYPFAIAPNPMNNDDLLLIIKAQDKPWRFGQFEYSLFDVLPGEIVDIKMVLAASTGR